jgi:DNA-directed RNA polymerase specialized sigma24 family protein
MHAMGDPLDSSVTQWIDRLRAGDDEATRRLWERYFERLMAVARCRLAAGPRRVADEEDLALSVFATLCEAAAAGRLATVKSREDLWPLLVTITAHKAADQIRRETRVKRGSGRTRGDSIFRRTGGGTPASFDEFLAQEPSPEFVTLLHEELDLVLRDLRDDTLRCIASRRMMGWTSEQIAQELKISLRSVERKLNLIREHWTRSVQP